MKSSIQSKSIGSNSLLQAKLPNPFLVKLYIGLPRLLQCQVDALDLDSLRLNGDECWDGIDQIDQLAESVGKGVEWIGSAGASTTWEVTTQQAMNDLLGKIQEFNGRRDLRYIIFVELYKATV